MSERKYVRHDNCYCKKYVNNMSLLTTYIKCHLGDIISVNIIMDEEYILTRENCRQLSLLIWTLFISQFVQPVGGEGMGKGGG